MPQLRRLLIMAALKDVFSKARRKKEISPFTVKKKTQIYAQDSGEL